MTAIVFNCSFNGLGIIRDLGRRGIKCLALDCARGPGTFSRYARFVRCADPAVAQQKFVSELMEMGRQFDERPVLFPTNDEWAAAISQQKDQLSEFYLPCVADWPATELALQKDRFYAFAQERGYPVPRTWTIAEIQGGAKLDYPVAAKPICRRISSNDLANRQKSNAAWRYRLTVIRDDAQLQAYLDEHRAHLHELAIQEYVPGLSDQMITVGAYANRQHELLGIFTGRKVRGYPPDIGDCIVGQAENVPEHLVQTVRDLCRDMRYSGIGEFEFKRNAETGEYRLIEVNPRSWSWVGITSSCGSDLPWVAYNDLRNPGSVQPTRNTVNSGEVRWARIWNDSVNVTQKNAAAGYPEWAMSPPQWRSWLRSKKTVWAEFAWDDPLPGIRSLLVMRGNAARVLRAFLQPW